MISNVNSVHEQTTQSKIYVDRSGFKETDFNSDAKIIVANENKIIYSVPLRHGTAHTGKKRKKTRSPQGCTEHISSTIVDQVSEIPYGQKIKCLHKTHLSLSNNTVSSCFISEKHRMQPKPLICPMNYGTCNRYF